MCIRDREWVLANQFHYFSASNAEEFKEVLPAFADQSLDRPAVLEIFTDKENDIKILKGFRRAIHQDVVFSAAKVAHQVENLPGIKQVSQTEMGQTVKNKLKNSIKKLF